MIHLDTNFLCGAAFENSDVQGACHQWLKRGENFAASSIAWTEFLNGKFSPLQVRRVKNLLGNQIIAFEETQAESAARLFTVSGGKRGTLADCMIAATAICVNARLATLNRKDFLPFVAHGLKLV